MVWRSVVISQPARLKREHFSLVVEQEHSAHVPFEDISVLVLNNPQITLTHPVLSACADYGIALYCTGQNHQPNGVLLPFNQHSRTTRMYRLQVALDKPCAKRTWARIVTAKINNQAQCMALRQVADPQRLQSYARRIRSGDVDNLEGLASGYYFLQMFGRSFARVQAVWVNAALDYGYSILRGAVARSLVAHGLYPVLGLHHASEQNAFNLADDVIEPFRPVVDLYVHQQQAQQPADAELTPAHKANLIALLNADIGMPRGTMNVIAAIEQSVQSLVRVYEQADDTQIELPTLIALRQHRLEY